jgi:DtxR family transcriptional regulator, Mn-dependent transcriptional regulator
MDGKKTAAPATATMQDYLKALFRLDRGAAPVPTSALAEALTVSPSAVTAMSCKLHVAGLVRYAAYHGMALTPAGRREALQVLRAHRLVEVMMVEWMGYGWEDVDDEADRLEHVLSPEFVSRLDAQLGHPRACPHGDPIPGPNGEFPDVLEAPLALLAPGESATVYRVSSRNRELLAYLRELGIGPGVQIEVRTVAPFDGPLTIRVNDVERTVSLTVAQNVFVVSE